MRPTVRLNEALSRQSFEQRADTRTAIGLPILIALGGVRYSALLRNISSAGAMIETFAPLMVRSKIEFHCGSIITDSIVLWCERSNFGIRFTHSITDQQLNDQIARSKAVENWRKGRIPAKD